MSNELANLPTKFPADAIAGDTLSVSLEALAADYPAADGYTVDAHFAPVAGGAVATQAATGGVTAWLVTVAKATTGGWAPGSWRWSVRVTASGGEELTVDIGEILIKANPETDTTDTRTHARKTLDAIEAVIEGRASATDLKTTFPDGRSIERLPHADLLNMQKIYAARVRSEKRRAANIGPGRLAVRL